VTPSTLRSVEKGMFRFALGGATFSDASGMGETLVIEGVPHISWVKEGKLLSREALKAKSPFLMGGGSGAINEFAAAANISDFCGQFV